MASSSISRTFSIKPNPRIPSIDPKIMTKPVKVSLQWHQKKPSPRASIHGGDAGESLELNQVGIGSASEFASKDSQTLPSEWKKFLLCPPFVTILPNLFLFSGPLTNLDLSNSGNGSRLRVAYQVWTFSFSWFFFFKFNRFFFFLNLWCILGIF